MPGKFTVKVGDEVIGEELTAIQAEKLAKQTIKDAVKKIQPAWVFNEKGKKVGVASAIQDLKWNTI